MKVKIVGLVVCVMLSLVVDAHAQDRPATSGRWATFGSTAGTLLGALIAFLSLQTQARFQARREDERCDAGARRGDDFEPVHPAGLLE